MVAADTRECEQVTQRTLGIRPEARRSKYSGFRDEGVDNPVLVIGEGDVKVLLVGEGHLFWSKQLGGADHVAATEGASAKTTIDHGDGMSVGVHFQHTHTEVVV